MQTANIKTGDVTGLNLSVDAKDGETVYELSIKWKDLFGYDFSPKANDSLGFGFIVNDNDGDGRRGWIEYAEGIGSSKDTNKLSTLVFKGEKEYIEDDIEYVPFRYALTSLGADFVKIFPSNTLGLPYLKAIMAPLSHIRFLAVGGVDENNIGEFVKSGVASFGIGSGIVNKQHIKEGNWAEVTALAKKYTDALK